MNLSNNLDVLLRRVPRACDLAALSLFHPAMGSGHSLRRTPDVRDLRAKGEGHIPIAPLDYVDGGADAEVSMARVTDARRDVEFRTSTVRDIEKADLSARFSVGQ